MSREDELLEKLDECENATAFLQVSNKIINLKLKALLPSVFVQDDLVKEYAVDPLLKEDGPLVTTDVVSKLMFAMAKSLWKLTPISDCTIRSWSTWLANRRKSNLRMT